MTAKRLSTNIIIALLLACLLAGCGTVAPKGSSEDGIQNGASEADLSALDGKTTLLDYPEEDLKKPDVVIKSLEDYIYLLEYMAFYRIGEKVYFLIDPAYAEEIYNPYTVHQKAYQMADLADVYACNLDDAHYSENGVIGIQYSMSRDIASEPSKEVSDTKVVPSFDYQANGDGAFPPCLTGDPVHCENSEQLYYLAMNGFLPVPKEGSVADALYQEAQKVLNERLRSDMTDFQKIKEVFDWLTTEVRYDGATAYSVETYLVKEQAYYLEGVFFNHCAVCDGKAKACALLLNMAGVPCLRTTGVNEEGDHAWNMVKLNGTWYLLCTTYSQKNRADSLGRILPDYSMFLAGAKPDYLWYPAQKHQDVEALLSPEAFDRYEALGEEDGFSLKVKELGEVKELLKHAEETAKDLEEYKVEFLYTGSDKEAFEAELAAALSGWGYTNAAPVPCEYGTAYQVIRLSE